MKLLPVTAVLLPALLVSPALAAGEVLRPDGHVKAEAVTRTVRDSPFAPSPRVHRPRTKSPAELRAAKRASAFPAPLASPQLGPAPAAGISASLNQPGLDAGDNAARNQGTPPDPTGAIGPSHYVEFVNSKVAAYSRTDLSAPVATPADLDTFVGHTNDDVFDPQIQWDEQGGRWFYLADDLTAAGENYLAFGWSKTSDPSDLVNGWCRYRLLTDTATDSFFDDYPKLGHDDSHLIFGTNVFSGSTGLFLTARIWSLDKPASGTITSCPAAPTASFFGDPSDSSQHLKTEDGDEAFTPVPADTADSSTAGYVVAADDHSPGSANQIMAWHVSASPSDPSLFRDGNISVTSYSAPKTNVPQPGSPKELDSLDGRLTQAVAHADPDAPGAEAVWTQHTVDSASGASVAVRWYELLPATRNQRQEGTISAGSNYAFNGAISPAGDGSHAAIEYNVGGSSQLVQIRAQSRAGSDPLGTMTGEVTLATSADIDKDFSCSPPNGSLCRWGDYAAATPDPSNSVLVWGTNQLNGPVSGNSPAWTTQNFALDTTASPPSPPSATTPTTTPTTTTTTTPTTTLDTTAPVLDSLRLSTGVFRAASSGPSIAVTTGTTVRYVLSEAATTTFRVQRAAPGRKVGGRCVRPTDSNRNRPACSRYVTLRGSFSRAGRTGANSFKFTGRLAGKKLRPARYRLVAVARDAAANKSAKKHVRYRIVS